MQKILKVNAQCSINVLEPPLLSFTSLEKLVMHLYTNTLLNTKNSKYIQILSGGNYCRRLLTEVSVHKTV